MRKQRTTLLAGVAALALVAGAGIAAAQQAGNEQHGAKQPSAASHEMNKSGAMGQNAAAPNGTAAKMDKSAAEENKARPGKMGENADTPNGGKMDRMDRRTTAQDRTRERSNQHEGMTPQNQRNGQAAERDGRAGRTTAEQERNGLRGLQGNARVNVQINDQQRTRIRETVIDARGAPRVAHVDFNVTVGTVIPRSGVRIVPVPETLVTIDPSWRGLNYFIYEQELVLIDPATMTIVAVINV